MSAADRVTVAQLTADPHPSWHRLRAEAPVARVPALGGWVVLDHPTAAAVLRDAGTFTVDDPRFSTARVFGPSMLSTEGAVQARHRAAFTPPLRPGPVRSRYTGLVRAEARRLLAAGNPVELRGRVAAPLATTVMCRLLGLAVQPAVLLDWYAEIVAGVDRLSGGGEVGPAAERAHGRLRHELARTVPTGTGLTEAELAANAGVLLFGGIETTEAMIALAAWHLLGQPAQAAAVRADRTLLAGAVEESMRLEPAASRVDRYATRDVELAGASIRAGELVIVSLAAANRDPAVFAEPDYYDATRQNAHRNLTFAAGPHYCLGAHLARLEAATVLDELLDRSARLVAAEPPRGLVFRKPRAVTVAW